MRAFLLLVFICSGWAALARPANLPPIEFVNTARCNTNPDALPACHEFTDGDFDDWDASSKAMAQAAIAQMPDGKLNGLIDLLVKAGLRKIQYVKKSAGKTMAGTMVDGDTAYIELDKDFFATPLTYPGGVSEKTHALIHELVHVYVHYYVGNNLYSAPFWDGLKGALEWQYPEGLNGLVDAKEWAQHFVTRNRLRHSGQYDAAISEDLNYARKLGFPSLYSMSQLEEYFAELVSFLVHDPTMESAPPPQVINWFLKTNLAFLLRSQSPVAESLQFADRHADESHQFQFVGMLFFNDNPICTVTILRHGLIVLARHCLNPSWFSGATAQSKYPFLNAQFELANGQTLLIDGMSMKQVEGDVGNNDLAYIRYPAEQTSSAIVLPVFDLIKDANQPPPASIFTVGYPMPDKVQHLERMVSAPCQLTGQRGEIPGYKGLLVGTTCPAWFGASGSLFYSASKIPGHLNVWGVLSHTFSVDSHMMPLPSVIKKDNWGSYTDSNFSPLWLAQWSGLAQI